MTCPDCGTNLDHTPVEQPCPTCGGVRRNAVVHAAVASGIGVVSAVGISIGYGPNRPWQQKWHDARHGLEELEATYRKDSENNDIVRRRVEDFFRDCRELADWLKQSANRPEAMSYVNTDSDLELCDGMAQTTKHHSRKPTQANPDPITARITRVDSGFGVKAEIGWSSHRGRSGIEEALDLARRCMAAWRRFFQKYNLDPTS
jgi:hypothetical protein